MQYIPDVVYLRYANHNELRDPIYMVGYCQVLSDIVRYCWTLSNVVGYCQMLLDVVRYCTDIVRYC